MKIKWDSGTEEIKPSNLAQREQTSFPSLLGLLPLAPPPADEVRVANPSEDAGFMIQISLSHNP